MESHSHLSTGESVLREYWIGKIRRQAEGISAELVDNALSEPVVNRREN